MGLHRDGTEYGFGAVDTHVRRVLWYQLCLLDIRTCEAQGPRPVIRAEDFDTHFPSNVDDADLEQRQSSPESAQRWTDMTLTLIRMECNEIIRVVWVDRPRLEKKKISLTAVLGKVENFRRMMREKYMSFIDDKIPVEHAGRLIFEIQSLRMHAMILHRYHNSVAYSIPGRGYQRHPQRILLTYIDRLRQIIITSGVTVMECAIELETLPALRIWSWYAGAIQQYHYALLILIEIYAFPMRKEADRIWACLDYVYDVPRNLTREQKGRWIITQIRDKTGVYMSARKARAPAALDNFSQQTQRSATSSTSPVDPSRRSFGGAQMQSGELRPAIAPTGVSYGQPANTPYIAATNSSAPPQMPSSIAPSAMPPMSDAPMVDIDWVGFVLSPERRGLLAKLNLA